MKSKDVARWIVGLEQTNRLHSDRTEVYVVASYATRKDAERHVAEISRYEAWKNVKVFDQRELDVAFSLPEAR